MDYLVTGAIVLAAVIMVIMRLVRAVKRLLSPGSDPPCDGACTSCPAFKEGTDGGVCTKAPDSWEV